MPFDTVDGLRWIDAAGVASATARPQRRRREDFARRMACEKQGLAPIHFQFSNEALCKERRATDYGDKVQRAIGTTDPGAVPGGSTITLCLRLRIPGILKGPN